MNELFRIKNNFFKYYIFVLNNSVCLTNFGGKSINKADFRSRLGNIITIIFHAYLIVICLNYIDCYTLLQTKSNHYSTCNKSFQRVVYFGLTLLAFPFQILFVPWMANLTVSLPNFALILSIN